MQPATAAARDLTDDDFRFITGLLHDHTGIQLGPAKHALVAGRLEKRIRQLGLSGHPEYARMMRAGRDEAELHQMINLLTTNETFFFREYQHFDYLRRVVLPARERQHVFRLWSAASSTGEEAFTAAFLLAEELPPGTWEILASDISTQVVDRARRALYPIAATERIPPPLLRKYCLKGRDEYEGLFTISPELRSRVEFHCLNLINDLRKLGLFDVIMLRNVMIYFDMETKRSLIPRLQQMLRPGGYLIIGSSESLSAIPSGLRMVQPSIYRLAED